MTLPARTPTGQLHRIGRDDDAWAWPDWLFAGDDGTFGNRWDDPLGKYRVLYACSQRLGAFVETLARFRPDPHVAAGLEAIVDDEPDEDVLLPGQVHASWVWARRIGTATVEGSYAEVGAAEWLGHLNAAMAARLIHYEVNELDGADLRRSAPRRLTQEISRYVFEQVSEIDEQAFDGICYLSRLGDDFTNWAIFEPDDASNWKLIADAACERFDTDDQDLCQSLKVLKLTLVGV